MSIPKVRVVWQPSTSPPLSPDNSIDQQVDQQNLRYVQPLEKHETEHQQGQGQGQGLIQDQVQAQSQTQAQEEEQDQRRPQRQVQAEAQVQVSGHRVGESESPVLGESLTRIPNSEPAHSHGLAHDTESASNSPLLALRSSGLSPNIGTSANSATLAADPTESNAMDSLTSLCTAHSKGIQGRPRPTRRSARHSRTRRFRTDRIDPLIAANRPSLLRSCRPDPNRALAKPEEDPGSDSSLYHKAPREGHSRASSAVSTPGFSNAEKPTLKVSGPRELPVKPDRSEKSPVDERHQGEEELIGSKSGTPNSLFLPRMVPTTRSSLSLVRDHMLRSQAPHLPLSTSHHVSVSAETANAATVTIPNSNSSISPAHDLRGQSRGFAQPAHPNSQPLQEATWPRSPRTSMRPRRASSTGIRLYDSTRSSPSRTNTQSPEPDKDLDTDPAPPRDTASFVAYLNAHLFSGLDRPCQTQRIRSPTSSWTRSTTDPEVHFGRSIAMVTEANSVADSEAEKQTKVKTETEPMLRSCARERKTQPTLELESEQELKAEQGDGLEPEQNTQMQATADKAGAEITAMLQPQIHPMMATAGQAEPHHGAVIEDPPATAPARLYLKSGKTTSTKSTTKTNCAEDRSKSPEAQLCHEAPALEQSRLHKEETLASAPRIHSLSPPGSPPRWDLSISSPHSRPATRRSTATRTATTTETTTPLMSCATLSSSPGPPTPPRPKRCEVARHAASSPSRSVQPSFQSLTQGRYGSQAMAGVLVVPASERKRRRLSHSPPSAWPGSRISSNTRFTRVNHPHRHLGGAGVRAGAGSGNIGCERPGSGPGSAIVLSESEDEDVQSCQWEDEGPDRVLEAFSQALARHGI